MGISCVYACACAAPHSLLLLLAVLPRTLVQLSGVQSSSRKTNLLSKPNNDRCLPASVFPSLVSFVKEKQTQTKIERECHALSPHNARPCSVRAQATRRGLLHLRACWKRSLQCVHVRHAHWLASCKLQVATRRSPAGSSRQRPARAFAQHLSCFKPILLEQPRLVTLH